MIFQVFYEFATFHGTLFMDSFHRNPPHFPPFPHSPQQPVQSPLEPYSIRISKARLLYDRLDDLGFKFSGLERFFNYVGNPLQSIVEWSMMIYLALHHQEDAL